MKYVKRTNQDKYYFVDYVANGTLFQARFENEDDAKTFGKILDKDNQVTEVEYTEVRK